MSFKFDFCITLTNNEGREDPVFQDAVSADREDDLLQSERAEKWQKAVAMSDVRADDGTDWDVQVTCTCVTEPGTGVTDWQDDTMPQRDEVTTYLNEALSRMAPANA